MIPVASLQRRVDRIEGFVTALRSQESGLVTEIDALKSDIDILTKSSAVLKHLLDVMVKDEMQRMASLVTYGLRTIFEDQDLSFVPVIAKKNDKMHVDLRTRNGAVESGFGSYGGSVAVVESLLLRVLCILKMKFGRLMLLDETFAAVGEEYIHNTGKLVAELSKKMGLDVLLVTHQKEFQDTADHVYRVKESDKGLIMEKLK